MISSSMKLALVGALGALATVKAHGHVSSVTVGSAYYAGFDPSNPPRYGTSPILPGDNTDQGFKDYNSEELATNAPDSATTSIHAAASAGDTVTWFWEEWPSGHRGPVTTFMAACPSTGCVGFNGNAADNWFKTGEYGLDASGMWGSDYISGSNGLAWEFTIPSDIPQGYYLLRHEIIAMHTRGQPQFYPITMQIALTSSGTASPSPVGNFPAMYGNATDDALTWNIYQANTGTFTVPGIALYDAAAASSSKGAPAGSTPPTGTPVTTDATVSGSGGPQSGDNASAAASSPAEAVSSSSSGAFNTAVAPAVTAAGSSSASPIVSASTVGSPSGGSTSMVSESSVVKVSSAATAGPTTVPTAAASATCSRSTVYVTVTEA